MSILAFSGGGGNGILEALKGRVLYWNTPWNSWITASVLPNSY